MKQPFHIRLCKAMDIRKFKQVDIVERTKLPKSAVSQYVSGKYLPKQNAVHAIAQALDVTEAWLMGFDVPMEPEDAVSPSNIRKIEKRRFPLLGTIAADQPIFADQEVDCYVEAVTDIKADFCLKVKGDSMVDARINDGDVVFIREQPMVNDGEIAAVLIGEEATLKRVYVSENQIVLMSANPAYKPIIYKKEEMNDVRILGKAVSFLSKI